MNTTSLIKPAGLSLGLLFAALISSNAMAGPGPQYWAAQSNPRAHTAVSAAKADATPVRPCAGTEVVTITKPMMANGKGPMVSTQIGANAVCHMCSISTEGTKIGAEHNHSKCTGTPAKT
jgi:hypothetical protein